MRAFAKRIGVRGVVCAVLGWSAIHATAADAVPPLIAAEVFTRLSEGGRIEFSPDGKRFATVHPDKGRMGLVVVDYATNKGKSYYSDVNADVVSFRWLTNDLIQLQTAKLGTRVDDLRNRQFAELYVSVDGKSPEYMSNGVIPWRNLPGSETDLIGEQNGWPVIFSSTTGEVKKRMVEDVPGPTKRGWVIDKTLAVRAVWGRSQATHQTEVWWRDSVQSPWRKVISFDREKQRGFYPVAMDADGHLIVESNLATGHFAIYRFDPATSAPGELLVGLPGADVYGGDLLYDEDRLDPVGVTVEGDKPQSYWFDEAHDKVQRAIDASLPKSNVNLLQFLPDGRVMVTSYGPTDPGSYYFYEPAAKTLTRWTQTRPWIDPVQMGMTTVMHYKARDGLDIPAYLTLPRGRPAKGLPLLVWVHGGPEARDNWGFDDEVQFFANRGYAVLQSNYRGSIGFGDDFARAGYKQWGLKMQDDLTDGVRALIARGTVDPQRVCIGGASYGGYAALMGPIKEPAMFRCAIDYSGPSDLVWNVELPEIDYNWRYNADVDHDLKRLRGDPDVPQERKVMEDNSPRLHADKLKVPVLLIYGTADVRVPLRHGTAMRDALQAAGATYEWKEYAGEGHGIRDATNTPDLLKTMGAFLERYNPATMPASTPASTPSAPASQAQ